MNTLHTLRLLPIAAAALLMAACSTPPTRPDGADSARTRLTKLQGDPQLANLAPIAIKEAEVAVVAAEKPTDDAELGRHLVVIADRKVEIASSRAQSRLLEDQRAQLAQQRERARLDSRTLEADSARSDANMARNEASRAKADASTARSEADAARMDTAAAQQQSEDMQKQIAALNAKATDRGLVITLGDLLFATGKSELRGGASSHLGRLAAFLAQYQDRSVTIEGHTDSVGSDETNQSLSERRAQSVKTYLVGQGIQPGRIEASGLGEGSPVAGNESSTGRQQNRRVEVIISNTVTSSR